MLIDEVSIRVSAGKGGDGSVSLKRNGQTAKGGPDGGNGGKGGDVYIQGIDDISALRQFQFTKVIKAENGIPGGRNNLYGRKGKDKLIRLPVGTVVVDDATGRSIEITDDHEPILIAKGGAGGRGNNEFKTATLQTPRFAEKGFPGEEKTLTLMLKIIADVGIIGLPNAGKSSMLEALTNATPKIGNYPYTTLEPNLGVLGTLTLADIPGLIEGASKGKGLGIKFLKHIERTRLLLHVIDINSDNLLKDYETVRTELSKYNTAILQKKEIVVFTKKDLLKPAECKEKVEFISKTFHDFISVSIFDPEDVKRLKEFIEINFKNSI